MKLPKGFSKWDDMAERMFRDIIKLRDRWGLNNEEVGGMAAESLTIYTAQNLPSAWEGYGELRACADVLKRYMIAHDADDIKRGISDGIEYTENWKRHMEGI